MRFHLRYRPCRLAMDLPRVWYGTWQISTYFRLEFAACHIACNRGAKVENNWRANHLFILNYWIISEESAFAHQKMNSLHNAGLNGKESSTLIWSHIKRKWTMKLMVNNHELYYWSTTNYTRHGLHKIQPTHRYLQSC